MHQSLTEFVRELVLAGRVHAETGVDIYRGDTTRATRAVRAREAIITGCLQQRVMARDRGRDITFGEGFARVFGEAVEQKPRELFDAA